MRYPSMGPRFPRFLKVAGTVDALSTSTRDPNYPKVTLFKVLYEDDDREVMTCDILTKILVNRNYSAAFFASADPAFDTFSRVNGFVFATPPVPFGAQKPFYVHAFSEAGYETASVSRQTDGTGEVCCVPYHSMLLSCIGVELLRYSKALLPVKLNRHRNQGSDS